VSVFYPSGIVGWYRQGVRRWQARKAQRAGTPPSAGAVPRTVTNDAPVRASVESREVAL
jgi:hypothetical protein